MKKRAGSETVSKVYSDGNGSAGLVGQSRIYDETTSLSAGMVAVPA